MEYYIAMTRSKGGCISDLKETVRDFFNAAGDISPIYS